MPVFLWTPKFAFIHRNPVAIWKRSKTKLTMPKISIIERPPIVMTSTPILFRHFLRKNPGVSFNGNLFPADSCTSMKITVCLGFNFQIPIHSQFYFLGKVLGFRPVGRGIIPATYFLSVGLDAYPVGIMEKKRPIKPISLRVFIETSFQEPLLMGKQKPSNWNYFLAPHKNLWVIIHV